MRKFNYNRLLPAFQNKFANIFRSLPRSFNPQQVGNNKRPERLKAFAEVDKRTSVVVFIVGGEQ